MAGKKGKASNCGANGKAEGRDAMSGNKSSDSSSSLPALSLPGLILAIGAVYIYHFQSSSSENVPVSNDVVEPPSRKLLSPQPGSWTDGFYTTEPVPNQNYPSTHALLYENGGIGEPTLVSFSNDEEFLSLGRLYNDLGQIVQSPSHFSNGTALYRGPTKPGTHFQWPAVHVGYKRPVPGLVGGNGKQIELETLTEPSSSSVSSNPRVFYVHNFLSEQEADEFIRFSTAEENPYKMAHSTGGTHKAWNQGGEGARISTRTSMNAFDITTPLSFHIKKRAFRLLRMGGYKENLADGIQILRYELGQAYVAHHDYFPAMQSEDHAWNPLHGGSNRFATVFLYLSDVEVGGQTVFPNSKRLTKEKSEDLVKRLGEAPSSEFLKELQVEAGLRDGSWEDRLISQCYSQFAVPPREYLLEYLCLFYLLLLNPESFTLFQAEVMQSCSTLKDQTENLMLTRCTVHVLF